jgi:hypothetical protein
MYINQLRNRKQYNEISARQWLYHPPWNDTGDAFEYFLKESAATKNDLGEYFTPRHIVKTMVKLANPQIGERIYDPFCGTGNFLTESFRHIWNTMARNDVNKRKLKEKTIFGNIKGHVGNRNEMAHAKGRFTILNEDAFGTAASGIFNSIKNIHKCMDGQIRIWFKDFLLRYCAKEFAEYDEISDIITEQMIQGFNLSAQELLVCSEMSVSRIIFKKPEFTSSLNEFKRRLRRYCKEQGYVN